MAGSSRGPSATFYRVLAGGDQEYRGLAICASKFTGETNLRSLLVVRQDDPANGIEDLAGADYGYINTSCSSTYYPPAVLLNRMGERLDQYLTLVQLSAGFTWEPLIQAVIDKKVRATMVLEDVWNTFPRNAKQTKVIGTYQYTKGGIVIARAHLGDDVTEPIVRTLVNTVPPWDAVYGGFLPYYLAQTHSFFHDLELLPAGL